MAPIVSFTKSLSRIFPPDDPDSPWLIRLAILRDDFSYELSQIGLKPDDPPDAVWRSTYMLRKIGITIGEVTSIFRSEVARRVPDIEVAHGRPIAQKITEAIELVRAAHELFKPTTGRFLPRNRAYRRRQQWAAAYWRTTVRQRARAGTSAAFLFAWPDVKSVDDYGRKHDELSAKLFACMGPLVHTIDFMFYLHLRKLGLTSQ